MGFLLKTLSPVSSYAAKQTDQWSDLKDRVDGALLESDLDEFLTWLNFRPLEYPSAYLEPLLELIDAKRAELRSENVGEIMRERFDF